MAPTAGSVLRARLVVFLAALAAVLAAVLAAAFGWSRLVGDHGADEAINLGAPGVYAEPAGPTNPPLPTDRIPDVELLAADGSAIRLSDGDGRPMIVNLWYSTCPPCARELGELATVHGEVGDVVRFVGVNPRDTPATMDRFARDRGVRYELLRDPDFAFADELRLVAFPVTLFVDADGRIVARTGPLDAEELRQEIAAQFQVGA